jgi:hypothetical protein
MAAGGAAASGAAAAAAIANAIKASGSLVKIDREEFIKILAKADDPLVVIARGGLFTKHYKYLINYKGFFFYSTSNDPLPLPNRAEVVTAKSIWIPG